MTLRLVPIGERHVPALAELAADPVSVRFTRIPEPAPPGFAREWYERYVAGAADGTRAMWAVEDDEGRFLAVGVAPAVDRAALSAELGYIVAPHARGRGVATWLLTRLSDWALAEGMLRLELLISAGNEASKKVAARCGYRYEGTLRSVHLKEGVREDTEVWSLLATDPRP